MASQVSRWLSFRQLSLWQPGSAFGVFYNMRCAYVFCFFFNFLDFLSPLLLELVAFYWFRKLLFLNTSSQNVATSPFSVQIILLVFGKNNRNLEILSLLMTCRFLNFSWMVTCLDTIEIWHSITVELFPMNINFWISLRNLFHDLISWKCSHGQQIVCWWCQFFSRKGTFCLLL